MGTGWRGSSNVTRGTTAETSNFLLGRCVGEILKLATDWSGKLRDRPATPEILVFRCERERHSVRVRRSDTNEADDAESRRARASMEEPPGASIRTRQVIRRELDVRPAAALDVTGWTDVPVDDGELCSLSKCKSV